MATEYDVLYDALNRRVAVYYAVRDDCTKKVSALLAEKPRRFFYDGQRLLTEVHYDDPSGAADWFPWEETVFVYGVDTDMPFMLLYGEEQSGAG